MIPPLSSGGAPAAEARLRPHVGESDPRDTPASILRWGIPGFAIQCEVFQASLAAALQRLYEPWQQPVSAETVARIRVEETPDGRLSVTRAGAATELCSSASIVPYIETLTSLLLRDHIRACSGMHASVVRMKGGSAAVFVGRCTSGKSTLACGLAFLRGHTLLSDDVAWIRNKGGCEVCPGPRRASLRQPSRALLGEIAWANIVSSPSFQQTEEGVLFSPAELAPSYDAAFAPLRAVFLIDKLDTKIGAGESRPMQPAEAAMSLAPHSYERTVCGFGSALRAMGPIVSAVPVYELRRGRLDRVMDLVEGILC